MKSWRWFGGRSLLLALSVMLCACGADKDCDENASCEETGQPESLGRVDNLWMVGPGGDLIALQILPGGTDKRLLLVNRNGALLKTLASLSFGKQIHALAAFPASRRVVFQESDSSSNGGPLRVVDLQTGQMSELAYSPSEWLAEPRTEQLFLNSGGALIVIDVRTGLTVASHPVAVDSMVLGTQGWLRVISGETILTLAPPYDRIRTDRLLFARSRVLSADDAMDRVFLERPNFSFETEFCVQDRQQARCLEVTASAYAREIAVANSSKFFVVSDHEIPFHNWSYEMRAYDPASLREVGFAQLSGTLNVWADVDGGVLTSNLHQLEKRDPETLEVKKSRLYSDDRIYVKVLDIEGRRLFGMQDGFLVSVNLDTFEPAR